MDNHESNDFVLKTDGKSATYSYLKTKLEKYNVYELKITLDYTFDEENPRPHFANI